VATALAASLAGITNEFVNDDVHLIANNVRVQDLSHWREWFTMPFWPPPFSPDLYRPFTSAWLTLQYIAGDGSPVIFRFASYLLYAACCLCVYLLAKRLMRRPYALAAAVLFAAHPVHVEAVALAVGQAELIVALIGVVMTLLYVRWREEGALRTGRWAGLALLYILAILTKEQGLVLPALLIAAEVTLVTGPWRARLRSIAAGFAVLAGVAALSLYVRHLVLGELGGTFTAEALIGLGVGGRVTTMLGVVPQWLRLLAWPAHLRADYSPQEFVSSSGFGWVEGAGLAIVLASLAVAWLARRRAPVVTLGILWMAVALLPVSNIVPTGILIAERTLILPSVGFVLACAGGIEWLIARYAAEQRLGRALVAACVGLVALGVGRSAERQLVWRNEGYFVARGVSDSPRSYRMQRAVGDLLLNADQPDAGREAYARALAYVPRMLQWRVHNDYARALEQRGMTAEAVSHWRASLAQRPDQEYHRGELITDLLSLGEYAEAHSQVDSAVAHGANPQTFSRVRQVADSAAQVRAPVGSVKMSLAAGRYTADR
jgi:protein O-mannosyl-transferase